MSSVETDLDQYYTPAPVAQRMIEAAAPSNSPLLCVDPTCGSGNLLAACESIFERARCFGLDRDQRAIRVLKRSRPHWTLSVGNLLCNKSLGSTRVLRTLGAVDLLTLNPPFSQSGRKFVEVMYEGEIIRASVAMGYVLRSIDLFRPVQGAIAVVPESLLYSDIDSEARSAIGRSYDLAPLFELCSSTFFGARARTVAVKFGCAVHSAPLNQAPRLKATLDVQLVRGTLPVHLAGFALRGTPFIHSTDLGHLATSTASLRRVTSGGTGRVLGWQLLLPRVGLPKQEYLIPVFIRRDSQLSDCVIALGAGGQAALRQVTEEIAGNWGEFVGLYRGTGARYVTVARLRGWLESRGIEANAKTG